MITQIGKRKEQSSKARNEHTRRLLTEELDGRLFEARLSLAIGLFPVLAQLSKECQTSNSSKY